MLYAANKSETTFDPVRTYCLTIGNSGSTFLASTATRKASFVVVSSLPKTHCLSPSQPSISYILYFILNFRRANKDSSISTICLSPPITIECFKKYSAYATLT